MKQFETTFSAAACQAAADYNARFNGLALVVQEGDRIVFEDYPHMGAPDRVNELASGTKTFAGVLALLAVADGLLQLDERAAETLDEWQPDPRKSRITLRQLLQLVSGLEGGGKPGYVPSYAKALEAKAVFDPGERFLYGSAPFQAFGEILRRKLETRNLDPLEYLETRLWQPLGISIRNWRHGADGLPQLASGAALTAREWARFGQWILQDGQWAGEPILPAGLLAQAFVGTTDNPGYGLCWWLNAPVPANERARQRQLVLGLPDLSGEPQIASDLVLSAGAGKQRLYVCRSQGWVVARQSSGILEALSNGEQSGFCDLEFLRLLHGNDTVAK